MPVHSPICPQPIRILNDMVAAVIGVFFYIEKPIYIFLEQLGFFMGFVLVVTVATVGDFEAVNGCKVNNEYLIIYKL